MRSPLNRTTAPQVIRLFDCCFRQGIFDACAAEITTWGRADLKDVEDGNLGLNGSPTKIAKASDKVRKGAGEKVTPESPEEAVSYIVGKLDEKHII